MATSPPSASHQRARWAFWVMCALSAVAAVELLVVGGSNRLGAPVISFTIAALASGACALLYTLGRQIASLLYFLASLVIVYGTLAMVTLPLRLRDARPLPPPAPPTRRNPPVPTRRIPPVVTKTQGPMEAVTPEAAPPPTAVKTESEPVPEPMLELAAPVEALELPAVGTEDRAEAPAAPAPAEATPAAAPPPKPRRRRAPKPPASPNNPITGGSA